MLPGHVILNASGAIVEADDSFAALLMSDIDSLRGRNVLSFTAPADRNECATAIAGLQATGQSFDITKRFLRGNDGVVWVRNTVSRLKIGRTELIFATCAPHSNRSLDVSPAALLLLARQQAAMVYARSSIGDPAMLSCAGWPTLLEAYIAEAEGRIIHVDGLAEILGQDCRLVQRWVNTLVFSHHLEVEFSDKILTQKRSYRLTSSAIKNIEDYLIKFS